MNLKKKNAFKAVTVSLLAALFLMSCDEELNKIGSEVVGSGNFETNI